MSDDVTEDQRQEAERVLFRYYMQWVRQMATGLAERIFRDEIEDAETLEDRMREDADSALIYTHDQRMVIATSESVNDGEAEMTDMGGGGENQTAVLAVLTFQCDIRDALQRMGLDHDFDRGVWIREVVAGEHGTELAILWDKSGEEVPEE